MKRILAAALALVLVIGMMGTGWAEQAENVTTPADIKALLYQALGMLDELQAQQDQPTDTPTPQASTGIGVGKFLADYYYTYNSLSKGGNPGSFNMNISLGFFSTFVYDSSNFKWRFTSSLDTDVIQSFNLLVPKDGSEEYVQAVMSVLYAFQDNVSGTRLDYAKWVDEHFSEDYKAILNGAKQSPNLSDSASWTDWGAYKIVCIEQTDMYYIRGLNPSSLKSTFGVE